MLKPKAKVPWVCRRQNDRNAKHHHVALTNRLIERERMVGERLAAGKLSREENLIRLSREP